VKLQVFLLVLLSSFTHALWNFFTKKKSNNPLLLWNGLWIVNLALLPYSISRIFDSGLALSAVPFMLGSGIAHALYFYALMRAYMKNDISVAYPIARGIGVGGTTLAAVWILDEVVSAKGVAGILLIFIGVLTIGLIGRKIESDLRNMSWPFLVGLCIVSYSLLDKAGVIHADPVVYINLSTLMAAILLSPFLLLHSKGTIKLVLSMRWKMSALIGLGVIGTYLLILFAFRLERASYVVAVREFSVVVGALMGAVFLTENLTLPKIIGIAAITFGLILVRLA
jgi:uncharacterized membrane protein